MVFDEDYWFAVEVCEATMTPCLKDSFGKKQMPVTK
jgi:hypothetical protein